MATPQKSQRSTYDKMKEDDARNRVRNKIAAVVFFIGALTIVFVISLGILHGWSLAVALAAMAVCLYLGNKFFWKGETGE